MTVRPARPENFFRVDAHFGQNPIEMLMAEGEAPLSAPQAKQILSRTESSKSAHTLTPSGSRRSTPRWSSASPSRCRGAWLWPHLGQRGLLALRLIKCFGLGRRSQLAPRRAALAGGAPNKCSRKFPVGKTGFACHGPVTRTRPRPPCEARKKFGC